MGLDIFNFNLDQSDDIDLEEQEKEPEKSVELPDDVTPSEDLDSSPKKKGDKSDTEDSEPSGKFTGLGIFDAPKSEDTPEDSDDFEDPAYLYLESFFDEAGWELEEAEKKVFQEAGGGLKGLHAVMDMIIEDRVASEFASPEVFQLNEWVKNGGNVQDFFNQVISPQEYDYSKLDTKDLGTQKWVLKEYYTKVKGLSEKKAIKLIEAVEEEGELQAETESIISDLSEKQEQRKAAALAEKKKEQERIKQANEAAIKQTLAFIDSATKQELGVTFNNAQKENFKNFLFNVNPKTGRTPYQEKLAKEPNLQLKLAALVFSGVTEGKLNKLIETDATDKVLKALQNSGKNKPKK
jgi:hypothetical protein